MTTRSYVFWILLIGFMVASSGIGMFALSLSIYKNRLEKEILSKYKEENLSMLLSNFLDVAFLSLDCKKHDKRLIPYVKNRLLLNGIAISLFKKDLPFNIVSAFIYLKAEDRFLLYRSAEDLKNRKKIFEELKKKLKENKNINNQKIFSDLFPYFKNLDKCKNKVIVGFLYKTNKKSFFSIDAVFRDFWIFILGYILLGIFISFSFYIIVRNIIVNAMTSNFEDYEKLIIEKGIADKDNHQHNKKEKPEDDIPDAISVK